MKLDAIPNYFANAIFLAASLGLSFAFVELAAQFLGWSLIGGFYSPGRIIELSAMLVLFAIAIWLRQICESLRQRDD